MSSQIDTIFNPTSIAIVGATNRPQSVGQAVVRNLIQGEYQGVIYPVHPALKSIFGVKAYKCLGDIPDPVELAIIIIKPEMVPAVIEEAAQKGISSAVVITAGFKEVGGQGAVLEKRIQELAARHRIRLVGPNCLGVINTAADVRMNASFARKMPRPGNIAFISQSGALCTSVLDYAEGRKIGFSKFISFGNKADVNEIDLLRYLGEDPATKVICMYLEDLSAGQALIEVASDISWNKGKPILASNRAPLRKAPGRRPPIPDPWWERIRPTMPFSCRAVSSGWRGSTSCSTTPWPFPVSPCPRDDASPS